MTAVDRGRVPRRAVGVAVLLTSAFAGTACSAEPCTQIGSSNVIGLAMPAGVVGDLGTIELRLCQGDHCSEASFSAVPVENEYDNGFIEQGVELLEGATYSVDLDRQLLGSWDVDDDTAVHVVGRSPSGEVVVEHDETFTFTPHTPNGAACDDPPFLHHTTVVPPTEDGPAAG